MMRSTVALVISPTRMQGLLARWGTRGAAKFRLQQAVVHATLSKNSAQSATVEKDVNFDEYESEHARYMQVVESIKKEIEIGLPVTVVERRYLPNFDFRNSDAVVVVGQDGLVANTAKYATGIPIIGVNPDPSRIDGILVPFGAKHLRHVVQDAVKNKALVREVSLAKATLTDGQVILAFNDLFVGRRSHASARYTLQSGKASEAQSSSGVIISTGAGSTGWLSSVFNMTNGVNQMRGAEQCDPLKLKWEDRKLAWVVREPFLSKHSQITLVAGMIEGAQQLVLDSLMPESGVIFSDGIENDFLEFNSGTTVRISVASERANLVVPKH